MFPQSGPLGTGGREGKNPRDPSVMVLLGEWFLPQDKRGVPEVILFSGELCRLDTQCKDTRGSLMGHLILNCYPKKIFRRFVSVLETLSFLKDSQKDSFDCPGLLSTTNLT